MLTNKNILCISSIDWDFIWQGHQEIMTRLARNGNTILYIENTGVRSPKIKDIGRIKQRIKNWKKGLGGFREVEKNLFVFSPLVIPLPYSKIAQAANTWLMLRLIKGWMESASFHDPVIWTFLPTQLTINLIRKIKNECVIYYCIDSFVDSSTGARRIVQSEEMLYGLSDLVFVTSHKLFEKAEQFTSQVHFFPFAVNVDHFTKDEDAPFIPPVELKGVKSPIVGYIGGVHRWVDLELIASVAKDRPDWTIVMVGPLQIDISSLKEIENILFVGAKKHEELAPFAWTFDVSIIPYILADYTQNVYPTKLTEYLAAGKPVVSTPIFELEHFKKEHPELVTLARDKKSFIQATENCLHQDNAILQRKRMVVAEENAWEGHLENMSSLITDKIEEKKKRAISWQDQFSSFYYQKKGKVFTYISFLFLLWVFLFHSPILWFLAKPLIITTPLQQADAIVVFGGGVGESGKAGQGYIERTKQAIDLYQDKKAPTVLFMSGYTYMMKEAAMMKALGIAFGIPADKILLDTVAPNTYLSVLRTASFAKENGWKKIIFISSPYHMMRVRLCFKNTVPGLEIIYTPVKSSSFYGWPKGRALLSWNQQITMRQLKGLLHELMGITYYWYKGYI